MYISMMTNSCMQNRLDWLTQDTNCFQMEIFVIWASGNKT